MTMDLFYAVFNISTLFKINIYLVADNGPVDRIRQTSGNTNAPFSLTGQQSILLS